MKIFKSLINILNAIVLFFMFAFLFLSLFYLIKEGEIKHLATLVMSIWVSWFAYGTLKDIEEEQNDDNNNRNSN